MLTFRKITVGKILILGIIESSILFYFLKEHPINIYLFKVNNRNTRRRYEICSKLTIKLPERRHVVSVVNFEQVNVSWVISRLLYALKLS